MTENEFQLPTAFRVFSYLSHGMRLIKILLCSCKTKMITSVYVKQNNSTFKYTQYNKTITKECVPNNVQGNGVANGVMYNLG